MPDERSKRTWQEIAAEMARENDDDRLIVLCQELDAVLPELETENKHMECRNAA